MLVCQNCSHEQQSGKFCGQCGGPLVEKTAQNAESEQTERATNETASTIESAPTEQAQQASKNAFQSYVSFLGNQLKNPTRALSLNESHFGYGLITIAIYALAYALAIYFLANKLVKDMFGPFGSTLPFFDLTVPLLFYIALFLFGAIVGTFVAIKLMQNKSSFKKVIAQYGGLIIPFTIVNLTTILFGIAGMAKLTTGLTSLSLLFSLFFLPVLLAFHKGTKSQAEQKVYFSLGAAALSMLITYIIVRLAVLGFLDKFDHVFRWF